MARQFAIRRFCLRVALALVFGTGLSLGGSSAPAAQPASASSAKAPANAPAAASAKAPRPPSSATKDGDRAPADADHAGAAPETADLPPGHPPVDTQLPSGHPPIDGQARRPERASPHESELFDPPDNVAQDDPSLPAGTIAVIVKDADEQPIAGAPIMLGILHNTVARGESRERRAAQVGSDGSFLFHDLDTGSGTTYRVTTSRGPATYAAMPFALSDKAGKRVVVHAYEVSSNINDVLVGMQGIVYVQLREDAISVEHLFQIFNVGRVAWVPDDVLMTLPEDYKAFNKQETMSDTRFDEVKGTGLSLRGTFDPGRHELTFRYQVPLTGDEQQSIRIGLPPRVAQMRVLAEATKTMKLQVSGFPEAERTSGRDRKRLLVTERGVSRGEGGLKSLEISLSGLPTPGHARWLALLIAVGAVVGAVAHVAMNQREGDIDAHATEDLRDAREALLGEIVALERAHRKGDIGPKTYARVRRALIDSLARIVTKLDEARDQRAAKRKRSRQARQELSDSP